MKSSLNTLAAVVNCALAGLMLAGCAQFTKSLKSSPAEATAQAPDKATAHAPEKAAAKTASAPPAARDYGPAYAIIEVGDVRYTKSAMAFPTGREESSGLLVEKMVPVEVFAGQPFEYQYKVSNLTDHPIQMVAVSDRVTGNFIAGDSEPKPAEVREGTAIWQLGVIAPKESRVIRVKGSSQEEGALNTCGWASYSPVLCDDIRVVKASVQVSQRAPAEALVCDVIPVTVTVKNSGSSALTAVKVTETLPEGLLSDGKSELIFEAGNFSPGQTRDFTFNAAASKTGKLVLTTKAASKQGAVADAQATLQVREPVLKLSAKTAEEQYINRPFEVTFTLENQGDAAAAGSVLEMSVPAGLTVKSPTAGARMADTKLICDLGAVAADAAQTVSVTLVGAQAGAFNLDATAKAVCAKPVTATCQTRVVGRSGILLEKADDPDPIQVGETTTYTVKVTNQGTAADTNIRVVITLPQELAPVSGTGECAIEGQTVTLPPVATLEPKASVTCKLIAKGVKAGDARTRFTLTSAALKTPVIAEESTTVY